MAKQNIHILTEKYLKHIITEDEAIMLKRLLKDDENIKIFKRLAQDSYQLKTKDVIFNAEDLFVKVEPKLEQKNSNKLIQLKPFYKYAVAASIALLISLTFIFNKDKVEFIEPVIVNNNIIEGTDKATLTLEDGTDVALIKGQTYQTQNATSNGEQIVYVNNTSREIVNNYLTTARGEQFQITLADGTQVWLNSESQLKYPVSFTDGESRQVELVYGEAYFDVSPSTNHNGSKFKVYNKNQEIEVLGTEFNIKAYKNETNIYTTLVEGKVVINAANQNKVLSPTEQVNLDITSKSVSIARVDVYNEISWKEGVFSFEGKTLEELMKVLSRWYNIEVDFDSKDLKNIKFSGKLKKNQSIEEILAAIKNSSIINNFGISNKTVTLK